MKFIICILVLSLVILFLLVYESGIDVYSLEYKILNWEDLSPDLQAYIKSNAGGVIDVDTQESIKLYDSSITGVIPGRRRFTYNGVVYYFKWSGNQELTPFLIKDRQLYVFYVGEKGGPLFRTDKTLAGYQYYRFDLK